MSFTNETTHYSIPLPLGTDLTTPMDYNEAAQAVDTALFGAVQDAGTATADAADAKTTAQGAADAVTALAGRVGTVEGTVATQGGAITRNANDIADTRRDLSDSIEATVEPNATATYSHTIGDLFWYNDTLYRTTASISIGDTIVPDTNCTTTTVATEIAQKQSALTVTQDVVTPVAGITLDTPVVIKYGKLVYIRFSVVSGTTTTDRETIATLPTGITPVGGIVIVDQAIPSTGNYTYVDTDGTIKVRTAGELPHTYYTACFICN